MQSCSILHVCLFYAAFVYFFLFCSFGSFCFFILTLFLSVCLFFFFHPRCWFSPPRPDLTRALSRPVPSPQRVNGAVREYGLPAGLSAGAGEAVWDAESRSGGGAKVVCRHPAPPPPQHAGNKDKPLSHQIHLLRSIPSTSSSAVSMEACPRICVNPKFVSLSSSSSHPKH